MLRRTLTAPGLVALLLLPVWLRAADGPKSDPDLDGEWIAVSAVKDGTDLGRPPIKMVMTFKGDAFTALDATHTGKLKIDASKTPKTIDLIHDDGPDKGKPNLGVYEIKGDELRLCFVDPGKDRPTELLSKAGSDLTIVTFKRVKK